MFEVIVPHRCRNVGEWVLVESLSSYNQKNISPPKKIQEDFVQEDMKKFGKLYGYDILGILPARCHIHS